MASVRFAKLRRPSWPRPRAGFSLIELLVVVSIIALLVGMLAPSLSRARRTTRAVVCRAHLRSLMTAMYAYGADHADRIVPSYNMRGVTASRTNPLDGWGPILDRGGYVAGNDRLKRNPCACPDTKDIAGMADTRTGEPDRPHRRGYMDWPALVTLTGVYATTIPRHGFDRNIRVSYWINGDNTIGRPTVFSQGIHFTGSVGYGPDPEGKIMTHCRFDRIKHPARLITLADGLYSGHQELTRIGDNDSRIGYRHPGRVGTANVAFADGHVGAIEGDRFPRKHDENIPPEVARAENLGTGPTLYADPERDLLD